MSPIHLATMAGFVCVALGAPVAAEDALARILQQAEAQGLLSPKVLLINGARNENLTALDGSIVTWSLGPQDAGGHHRQGDLQTRVIGAMNTASMDLGEANARAMLVNMAENSVAVRAGILIGSSGQEMPAQGSLGTSAIGASNMGSIVISVGP